MTRFRRSMTFSCIAVSLLIAGCAASPPVRELVIDDPRDLLQDHVFTTVGEFNSLELYPNIFELPDNYKRELDRALETKETEFERYREVRRWIYWRFRDYDFDIAETLSLSELNTNRKINCLSFSTLFVAAARYAGVEAHFQLVFAPPYWDKEGGNWVINQHINVAGSVERPLDPDRLNFFIASSLYGDIFGPPGIKRRSGDQIGKSSKYNYTVDINPAIVSVPVRRQTIDEQQVLSLYHSNKSMEFLFKGDLAAAYAYTKQALLVDPDSAVAWNNLGVLYSRAEQVELSIASYERAIFLDSEMHSAKSNLVALYRLEGKSELAANLERSLEEYRGQNPYYHSALADSSMAEGEFEQAIAYLETAISKKHNEHYFYHQLAMAHQSLGHTEEIVEYLSLARRHARGTEKVRFAGKVKALEELFAANN